MEWLNSLNYLDLLAVSLSTFNVFDGAFVLGLSDTVDALWASNDLQLIAPL